MKLSIITVNLNNADGLKKTIESVVMQTFSDYEYIIIDGGSTDGSVEIIKQYADKITYWVSEPDKGIYNAMNKGILQAKGEYCYFLNSGDWFIDKDGLEKLFGMNPDADIIYMNIEKKIGENKYIVKYSSYITLFTFFIGGICHQAHFIKKILFNILGDYNEKYSTIADWEFLIRALIINQRSYKYYDITITHFDTNGISSSAYPISKQDREVVLKNYFPMIYDDYSQYKSLYDEINYSRLYRYIKKIKSSKIYNYLKRIRLII